MRYMNMVPEYFVIQIKITSLSKFYFHYYSKTNLTFYAKKTIVINYDNMILNAYYAINAFSLTFIFY